MRRIGPRHIAVLLHGVETAPGDINWPEKLEIVAQDKVRTPIEFISRPYGGLLLSRASAVLTLLPFYRARLTEREIAYFDYLRRNTGADARISIVAHSFGGYIACELLKRGFYFHRMVLLAPAAPEDFDWREVEDQFGLAFVYWSPLDEVLPWAFYGQMGLRGPKIEHSRVTSNRTIMKHNPNSASLDAKTLMS